MTASGEHVIPPASEFGPRCVAGDPRATAALGAGMAALLQGGEIVLLYGPLGAGKTCLVQGLCRELGVTDEVVSPTFTLVNTYRGRLTVHHLDFYRIGPGADLDDIGVPEILDQVAAGAAVALVEWPDPLLPALGGQTPRWELLALPGRAPDDRIWHLRGTPEPSTAWRALFDRGGADTC